MFWSRQFMAVDKFVLVQPEIFLLGQGFESLAKQNAQQARRITSLEAELMLAQATAAKHAAYSIMKRFY